MKWIPLLLALAAAPAAAQDVDDGEGPFSRQIERLLRDLFADVEPTLRELRDTIGSLDDYEAPEMLPNGDIIIRRKTPLDPAPEAPEEPDVELAPDDSIEL